MAFTRFTYPTTDRLLRTVVAAANLGGRLSSDEARHQHIAELRAQSLERRIYVHFEEHLLIHRQSARVRHHIN